MIDEIPGPYAWPIVGNLFDLKNEEGTAQALAQLADIYGPIYKLTLVGKTFYVIASAELLKLMTDEKQFVKVPAPALDNQQGARGLFNARTEDPDWSSAHRILTPAFGPLPVEDMFPEMKDIASQLLLKWARKGSDEEVLLTDDFTRLTLDTIAICAMDYRFNSFYQDKMHPFVQAMIGLLEFSGKRAQRPQLYTKWFAGAEQEQSQKDTTVLKEVAQQIIDRRRQNPTDRPDLLNTLLYGKDPKDGKPMRDELISANMVTFLIAGHETTSGLLSFAFMCMIQNPKTYLKAQAEVDEVLKGGSIQTAHLKQLKYVSAVLRETLRLHPTATILSKKIADHRKDEFVTINVDDHVYHLEPNVQMRCLLPKCQSDPSYFGEDAHEFNPDRMLETNPNFSKYMAAWKPFGNGSRGCIGQNFAWQEAVMVTALVLQNFDVSLADPNWTFHTKQTLTVKPKDLYVKLKLRKGLTPSILNARLNDKEAETLAATPDQVSTKAVSSKSTKTSLRIFYGSNSGTCQSLAQKLASAASSSLGLNAQVADLDSAVDNLSGDFLNLIVTCSYEGQAAENAARFVTWLEDSSAKDLEGVKYAVFGCGHKDWQQTFHRIPKLIDAKLEARGGSRILELGTCDVSQNNVLADFQKWQQPALQAISERLSLSPIAEVDPTSDIEVHTDKRASDLSNGLSSVKVINSRALTAANQPEKRHMEIELPAETTYECGDYLAILPMNPESLVKRVMAHWEFPWDATVTLKSKAFAPLPTSIPLSIFDILKGYFELSQQITKSNLEALKQFTTDSASLSEIDNLLNNKGQFDSRIVQKQVSLFEFLSEQPGIKMPFAVFLSNLMPLRVRQYSISSSPLVYRTSCTITYSVIQNYAHLHNELYEGVATTYLSGLKPGDYIQVAVRRTASADKACPFRLPADKTTPILGFCAGTGLAPLRGFIQQRAFMLEANPKLKLAPAIIFAGCRTSKQDRLYAEQFDEWVQKGVVDMRYAFSQEPQKSDGCKHISDRMLKDQEDIVRLWRQGARAYTCGSRAMLQSIRDATKVIFSQVVVELDESERENKKKLFAKNIADRVVADVFD